ncbi:unnamed protein product [Timema podura]|uniref:Dipeptidylpeptidase IV N-terminal domain-containing protein n=1 Tax=Timema podura TaxID=61482 RepID=A0ABN7NPC8_TIMPD|nr:unnamed protein product [Timema podura]
MSDREEVQRAHSLGSGGVELSLISGRSVESHHALSDEMGDIDRRSILVELRCIVVLLALSCAAVETEARMVVDQPRVIGQPFSLEEIIGGVFSQRGFGGTWVSGTEFLFADSVTGDILRYDVTTGTNTTLVLKEVLTAQDGEIEVQISVGPLTMQAGTLYLQTDCTSYFPTILNRVYSNVSGASYLQLARWSPRGSALVFVLDNNIFYRPNASNETEHQITRTGEPGVYYNGVPDWVYEEEVFGSGSAFWISPSGDSLAFAVFNDTEVNEFSYFLYGTPGDLEDQYVTLRTIKYPKSSENSPTVLKTLDGDHVEKGISLDLPGVLVILRSCSDVPSSLHPLSAVKRRKRNKNEVIRERVGVQGVNEGVEEARLIGYGHVMRMEMERIVKRMMEIK